MHGQQNIKIWTLHAACHPPGVQNYEMAARFSESLYLPDWFIRSDVLTSFCSLLATGFSETFVPFYKVVRRTIHYLLSAVYTVSLVQRRSRGSELQGSPDTAPL